MTTMIILTLKPKNIQVQECSSLLRSLSINYLFFVTTLFKLKARWMSKPISFLMWKTYVPSTANRFKRIVGGFFMGAVLVVPAGVGGVIRGWLKMRGKPANPMLAAIIKKPKR